MRARSWQKPALDWAIQTEGHRLIQAPPGTGKSFVGYALAAHWLAAQMRNRVIWAAPNIALAEQAQAIAWRYVRTSAFLWRAQIRAPLGARFLVTTHQSAIRFLAEARETDLLIFDEAHHANGRALANAATCARHVQCLGLSASPWSQGCDRAFPKRWVYPLSQALSDGMLVPLVPSEELPAQPAPHTLHFMASVAAAECAAQETRSLSFVEGDLLEKLDAWLRGAVLDLYVCQRLGEGYDVPPCARVVLHRDSRSPIWIYKAVGRTLRRHGNKERGEAFGIRGLTAQALKEALALADSPAGPASASAPPEHPAHPEERNRAHGQETTRDRAITSHPREETARRAPTRRERSRAPDPDTDLSTLRRKSQHEAPPEVAHHLSAGGGPRHPAQEEPG